MTYKDDFYKKYVSTHIVGRKPVPTLEYFRMKQVVWQNIFGRFLPQDKQAKIADLGCGDGKIVWWLQEIGFENAVGVDVSAEQVETASRLGVKNISHTDLKVFLKNKTNYYDMLILRDVIEHFNKKEILDVLEVCRDALRDRGSLIIQVPNAESPFFGRIRYGDFTHEIAFCSSSLSQVFNIVGLTQHEFHSVEPIFRGGRSILRRVLWKVAKGLYKMLLFTELGPGERIVSQDLLAVATKMNVSL